MIFEMYCKILSCLAQLSGNFGAIEFEGKGAEESQKRTLLAKCFSDIGNSIVKNYNELVGEIIITINIRI